MVRPFTGNFDFDWHPSFFDLSIRFHLVLGGATRGNGGCKLMAVVVVYNLCGDIVCGPLEQAAVETVAQLKAHPTLTEWTG